ncbi:MAG: hypothetical protein M3285_02750 [Actinomycetota bacterium]|nr:hypothetical protein [Actinomycetota bacterium]MDQ3954450.1 hypothetical protein [Actinomycetota bacterium]
MKIADEDVHRALKYIAAMASAGYPLTEDELRTFLSNPVRENLLASMVATARLPMAMTLPDWLEQQGWTRRGAGFTVEITDLGRAVLRHLENEERRVEGPIEVLLDPDDPFSYAQLIGELARIGPALLVDPFFKAAYMPDVVAHTKIDRVLASDKLTPADKAALAVGVKAVPEERKLEIRLGPRALHDRCVIPTDGNAFFLGTSLTGVGKSLTVFGRFSSEVSSRLRELYEAQWADADPVRT